MKVKAVQGVGCACSAMTAVTVMFGEQCAASHCGASTLIMSSWHFEVTTLN